MKNKHVYQEHSNSLDRICLNCNQSYGEHKFSSNYCYYHKLGLNLKKLQ